MPSDLSKALLLLLIEKKKNVQNIAYIYIFNHIGSAIKLVRFPLFHFSYNNNFGTLINYIAF